MQTLEKVKLEASTTQEWNLCFYLEDWKAKIEEESIERSIFFVRTS